MNEGAAMYGGLNGTAPYFGWQIAGGECVLTSFYDERGAVEHVRIERADPVMRINADLLQDISIATERGEPRWASLVGDVLTLRGSNRTVVYRIDYTDWDPNDDSYRAEWPD